MNRMFLLSLIAIIGTTYSQDPFIFKVDWCLKVEQHWSGSDWQDERKTINSFDNNKRPINQVSQIVVGNTKWENVNNDTYYYGASNKPDSMLCQNYASDKQQWINFYSETYAWETNKLTKVLTFSDSSLPYKAREVVIFDSLDRPLKDSMYSIDKATNAITLKMCSISSFTPNTVITDSYNYDTAYKIRASVSRYLDSIITNSAGQDSLRRSYLCEVNPIDSNWYLYPSAERTLSAYENGRLASQTVQVFSSADSSWKPYRRTVYSYVQNAVLSPLHEHLKTNSGQLSCNIILHLKFFSPFSNNFPAFDLMGRSNPTHHPQSSSQIFIIKLPTQSK